MTKYYLISIPVPADHADKMREAIGNAGAGRLGNYKFGSFSTKGIGRGIALEGANPHAGEVEQLEEVEEEKIEVFCEEEKLEDVLSAIKRVHPYENPVIVYFPVELV